MTEKTKEQLQNELELIQRLKEERTISNKTYAIKLIEKIVFGLVTCILLAVLAAIIKTVIIK